MVWISIVPYSFQGQFCFHPQCQQLNTALVQDPRVGREIIQAYHGVIARIDLMHPSIVAKVLWSIITDPLAYHK